jgi:acyl dehydratase
MACETFAMPTLPNVARAVRSFDSAQQHAASQWSFRWRFAVGDLAFAGHFPNHPILPGVFLLEMAQRAAEWALLQSSGRAFTVHRVERMRFLRPVLPGDACTLWLSWPDPAPHPLAGRQLSLSFKNQEVVLAHGSLHAVRTELPA